ncbi:MAG: phosphatidylserine/phosphatidylglycerophosphate/cardiolipin synthase family protein [Planctomycetota bacterium]
MSRSRRLAAPSSAAPSIEDVVRSVFAPHLAPAGEPGLARRLTRRWRHTLGRLRPLGGMSVGNRVELFTDGDALFEALWAAIDAARERVLLSTYILADDRVGRRTIAALAAAAERGVEVLLRYDSVGSLGLGEGDTERLRRAGGRAVAFNPLLTLRSRLSRRVVRDHRKVAVVDGTTAFCGGMNVAEEYAGERHGTGLFHDAHLRLEGPAAGQLEALFADASGPPARARFETTPRPVDGTFLQVLESNRWRRRRAIQRAMRYTLSRAEERAYLASPYFLPPRRLRRALTSAAQRGVDVRILTAGPSDVPIVRVASQHVYGRFLRAGVRIFELQERVLHAKTVVIDGVYASVGSFNLDLLSDRYNHEVNATMLDRRLGAALEAQLQRDFAGAREVTLESWENRGAVARVLGWIVYKLSRLL